MSGSIRRRELADFLKSRRKRLSPQEAGLPGAEDGRRHTQGLRREEVAVLAGISPPWYTALEQGRDIRVSDSVLDSLARTLKLRRDERIHLYMLADRKVPLTIHKEEEHSSDIPTELQRILDQFNHYPAYAIDGQWNLLAWNQAATSLFSWNAEKRESCKGNLLSMLFSDPVFRSRFVDWEHSASKLIAAFRNTYARRMEDPCLSAIVGRLSNHSAEFAAIWERHDVQCLRDNLFHIQHPQIGAVEIRSHVFCAPERDDITLVLYTPANLIDEERLKLLKEKSKSAARTDKISLGG